MDAHLQNDLKRYVPMQELRSFIERCEGLPLTACNSKDDAILHLDPLLTARRELMNELNEIISKYKFAGKGSVSWSMPDAEIELTRQEFQALINENAGDDPFAHELRPNITSVSSDL